MAEPKSISVAELRKLHPEYDQSGQVQTMTAAEYATGKRAWDRPLEPYQKAQEKAFQARVVAAFEANGCECCYHTFNSQKCAPGFPDLVICHEAELIVAELKVGTYHTNKPKPEQKKWLNNFVVCGELWTFLWYPDDWDCIVRAARDGVYNDDCRNWLDEPSRWLNRRGLFVKETR